MKHCILVTHKTRFMETTFPASIDEALVPNGGGWRTMTDDKGDKIHFKDDGCTKAEYLEMIGENHGV